MNLIREAFQKLYPEKKITFNLKLKYSSAFKGYNANLNKVYYKIKENPIKEIEIRLSKKWFAINKEIQMGLIQFLLIKSFKEKKRTTNVDIYHNFLKNIHIAIPKIDSHPLLESSFNRVNKEYFSELIEKPNLVFNKSKNKLGSYEYGTDIITISSYLKEVSQETLDYVMYHEMLHKKYKFKNTGVRTTHHTKEFKEEESKFKNSKVIETQLRKLVSNDHKKGIFNLFKTKMFL